jgi:hypothetical protein
MKYIVKDSAGNKMYMEVIGSMPTLPEGFELLGKADDLPEMVTEIEANKATQEQVRYINDKYDSAKTFGEQLMKEFATENIVMGITQDGMTSAVRKAMTEVILALTTASLYDAIAEAKAIPAEKKDPKYITDARLLSFINKIEAYLEIALSTEL